MADPAPFISFFHQSHAGVKVRRPFFIPSQLKSGFSKGRRRSPSTPRACPSVRPRVLLHSTSAFLKPGVSLYVTKLGFFLPEFLQAGNFIPDWSSEITPELGACWRQGERRGAGRPRRTGPYFQAVFQVLCLDTAGARGRPRAAQAAPAAPAPYWGKMKELEVPV